MSDHEEAQNCDWTHLPNGKEAISLWGIVHDASLIELRADPRNRSLTLEFNLSDVFQPNVAFFDNGLIMEIEGVSSLRAMVWQLWPGPVPDLTGLTRAEATVRIEEYQRMGREVSIGWESIELRVATEGVRVSDASVAFDARSVALRIVGHIGNQELTTLVAKGHKSSFRSRDRRRIGIDDLLGLQ